MSTSSDIFVSIIIPVYNVENYIVDCLLSVINQDYCGRVECLIVDDNSTDNSLEIIEEFISHYSGTIDFKILAQDKNGGVSAARNIGIKNALGNYLLFLDSDDELALNCLNELTKPLLKYNYDIVLGGYFINSNEKYVDGHTFKQDCSIDSNELIRTKFNQGLWYVMPWNKLCSKTFLVSNNLLFQEGIIYEDELWSLKLANCAQSMYLVSSITYFYKIRENSIMTTVNTNIYEKLERKIVLYTLLEKYVLIDQKYDVSNYDYLENKRNNLLNDLYEHRREIHIKSLYLKLHNSTIYSSSSFPVAHTFKVFIRDFHFIIPGWISYYFWYLYRSIYFIVTR